MRLPLGPDKSKTITVFLTLPGCDTVSAFTARAEGKHTLHADGMATEDFVVLVKAPKSISEEDIFIVEPFTILL